MSTPPTMADLQRQYQDKVVKYDAAIQSALASNDVSKIPQLQALNAELNSLLEQMLKESPMEEQRQELVTTLRRIQRDYNGLKNNTDTLELLRRIREGETGATRKEFALYLGLFFVTCLGLIAFVMFGGQMTLATTASTPTPIRTAPLM
jgi:Flp pilus assembly pilin Flp